MFARFLLLLILAPVVEIVLLVWLATKTSGLFALSFVVASALLGMAISRYQGWRAARSVNAQIEPGRRLGEAAVDRPLIYLAAGLLILPGILSDLLAVILLVPVSRRALKSLVRSWLEARVIVMRQDGAAAAYDHDEVIDVRVVDSPGEHLPG